jgi:hypothetical protein
MSVYDEIKGELTEIERAALETLISAGWLAMSEAFIESAKVDGFRYPTHTAAGRYRFCLGIIDLDSRKAEKPKKRGRPPKGSK